MDVIGAAASIIQILDVALQTTEALIRYGNDTKNASREKKVLVEETVSLAAILENLKDYAQSNIHDPTWLESRKDIVCQFQRAYQELATSLQLDIFTGKQKPETRLQAICAAAKWSFGKSEVYALVERITRLQHYATTLMIGDQGVLLKNIGQQQQREIERNLKTAVSKWLSPLQMNKFHHSISEQAQVGSGKWFLTSEKFIAWQSGNSNLLWCHGLPGAGKTVIASLVVNYLQRDVRANHTGVGVGIGFIYFKYNHAEQTLCNVLASLLNQLAQGMPNLPDHLRELYERCQDFSLVPTLSDVSEALAISIKAFSEVYFVIDALDECVDWVRWGLLERLRELNQSHPKIRILVMSRFLGDISEELKDFKRLEIKAHKEDIELFIDGQIQKNQTLRRVMEKSPSVRGDVKEAVLRTSKDMFLLARLHIDSLISAAALSIHHIRKKLNTLPTDLDVTYDEAMQRITNQGPDRKEVALKTLAWVSYTFRPLNLKELQHALAIEIGAEELDEEMMLDGQSITALCAGLVVIDTANDVVNLVHYTTKNYLDNKRQVVFPGFHGQIAMSCAAYLALTPLRKASIWGIVQNYPLACYAAQYMGDHARHNPEEALEQSVLDAIYQLLAQTDSRKPLLCLLDGLDLIKSGFYSSNNDPSLGDSAGNQETVEEHQADINRMEDYSNHIIQVTSLHLAVSMGLARVASMLLKETINIDAVDGTGKTALTVAIEKGFEKVVEFLVHSGARVDLHTDHGRWVFLLLAEKNWNGIAGFICTKAKSTALERDATVDLLVATFFGEVEELNQVLQREPSITEDTQLMETALFVAVECAHPAIVDRILSSHTDVNCKDSAGQTSLHRATRRGSESIIKVLLNHGADVNSFNDDGLTAWSANIKSMDERTLGHLLAAGADPNTKNPTGGVSELYSAAACGQTDLVRFMLKSGTNPSIQTDYSWAPLHWASNNGHVDCVRFLLDAGADPNTISDQKTTPLDLALRANQTEVIAVLLGAGAKEAKQVPNQNLGDIGGSNSARDLSLHTKAVSSPIVHNVDEVKRKVTWEFDLPVDQSIWFGQFIYPTRQQPVSRDARRSPGLNNELYQISHMLDSRVENISIRRAKSRPSMDKYPLDRDLFVPEDVLYEILRVAVDYQDLELRGNPENALTGAIRLRKGWSGSWTAHHVDGSASKLLFRSIPGLTSANDPNSRWVMDNGLLVAKTSGTLEVALIVEEGLDSRLLDALIACWVAKMWSETLTTHKGQWPGLHGNSLASGS